MVVVVGAMMWNLVKARQSSTLNMGFQFPCTLPVKLAVQLQYDNCFKHLLPLLQVIGTDY